jgi:hypothetical protein
MDEDNPGVELAETLGVDHKALYEYLQNVVEAKNPLFGSAHITKKQCILLLACMEIALGY